MFDNIPQSSCIKGMDNSNKNLAMEAAMHLDRSSQDASQSTDTSSGRSATETTRRTANEIALTGAIIGTVCSTAAERTGAGEKSEAGEKPQASEKPQAGEKNPRTGEKPQAGEKNPRAGAGSTAETLAGAARAGVEGGAAGAAGAKSREQQADSHRREKHEPTGLELPNPYPSGNDKDAQKSDLPPKMVGPDPRTMQKLGEELKKLLLGPSDKNQTDTANDHKGKQNVEVNKAVHDMREAILQGVQAMNNEVEAQTRK